MIMNSVHFIMDFCVFKETSFSQLKNKNITLSGRYDIAFFFVNRKFKEIG